MTKVTLVSRVSRSGFIFITSAIICLFICEIQAQKLSPTATNTHAFSFSGSGIFVDMSVGEVAVNTIKSSSIIITQGYLQPIAIETPCSSPILIYYPNPVVKEITIKAANCDLKLSYVEVNDLFGKLVLTTMANDNLIDLSSIGVGIYILRAYNNMGQVLGNVKIVKTTV